MTSFLAERLMFSKAVRFDPIIWMFELVTLEVEPEVGFEPKSEVEPVVFKEIEPAELMFDAKFVVLSVIEVLPFLLFPQLVSVRFLSCKVAMLILPPAVIERFPEVELESEIKFKSESEAESEAEFGFRFEPKARFEAESEAEFEPEVEAESEFEAKVGFNSVKSAFLDVEMLAAKLVKSLAALIEIEPPLIEAFCNSFEEMLPLLVAVELKAS